MTQSFKLILTANGPGEISNLVQPLCLEIKEHHPNIELELFLVPCQFATKNEKKVAESYGIINHIFETNFTIKFCLYLKKKPFECKNGAVLYLGGDPFYAKQIARRFSLPVFAYAETKSQANFKNVFRRSKNFDLMADNKKIVQESKADLLQQHNLNNKPYVLFFASSRNKQFQYLVPYYFETIKHLQKKDPSFSAIISTSPFVDSQKIKTFKQSCPPNTHLISASPHTLFKLSDFLVTIPGTNTAEAMYAGQSMLVVLPLIKPEVLDFPGLLGLLVQIPLLKHVLLDVAVWFFRKKIPLFSIPNILHNDLLVPELIGKVYPKDLAEFISHHQKNPKSLQKQQAVFSKENRSSVSTSKRIIQHILKYDRNH